MKFTAPTISFLGLVALAAVLGGTAYYLSTEVNTPMAPLAVTNTAGQVSKNNTPRGPVLQQYADDDHSLYFQYPPGWETKTYQRDGYDVITLVPEKSNDHVRIYISGSGYFGLGGMKTTPVTIGGVKGITINNTIFGVKQDNTYFTFDPGTDQSIMPEFDTFLTTIAFSK